MSITIVNTIDVDAHPTFKNTLFASQKQSLPTTAPHILLLDLGKIDFVVPWIQTLVMVK
jgi:hypothetical protein